MNDWAIERDDNGLPVRMVYMGRLRKPADPPPAPGCPGCGFHFGWHTKGCKVNGKRQHRASSERQP